MSRLKVTRDTAAQTAVRGLYDSLEHRLIAGATGNCPVEQCKAYVDMCLSESCGKCVPCRVGLRQMSLILERILDGDADMTALTELKKLATAIFDSADCAIGFGAAESVGSALDSFKEDFESHINNHRCIAEGEPVPCAVGCPAHVDIPAYIALTKEGRYADAIRVIRYDNPFPSICALVCEHPCEKACRRNMIDKSINIRAIKRMAVDNAGEVEAPACQPSTGKKIAVIGGAPSGLTAAYFLQLMGHQVTVYEQREMLGGMTRYGIPRYRLPEEYIDRDVAAILSTGIKAYTGVSIDEQGYKDILAENDAVYIAIGAHNANALGVEGEDAFNVMSAVELLRGTGVREFPDFEGKRIVIVGGGNVAMDCTRTALRLGAADVKCVYRRRREDMTALDEEIDGAIAEGCDLVELRAPVRVEKDASGKVAALIVQPQIPGAYDRGRPKPIKADLPEERIECDIIIAAIGQAIDSKVFEAAGVKTNKSRFVTDEGGRSEGDDIVFVGGDCQSGPSTVIRAVEAGKTAAANIDQALGFHHVLERPVEIPPAAAGTAGPTGRINLKERTAKERRDDFDIMEQPMTLQECQQECSRCLRCDHHGMGALRGGRQSW